MKQVSGVARQNFTNIADAELRILFDGNELQQGDSIEFSEVDRGGLSNLSLTIENIGSDTLRIKSATLSPQTSFFIITPSSFPVILEPGQSLEARIRFVPAKTGLHSSLLQLNNNDPNEDPFVLNLSGRSVDFAFRFKEFLYSRDGQYIYGKLAKISTYWKDFERELAKDRINEFSTPLAANPKNRASRRVLLDVYYDIALAELLVGQEKVIEALEMAIGVRPVAPGELLIGKEIDLLEEARVFFKNGLKAYFDLLNDSLNVDTSSVDPEADSNIPFGYYIFTKEVPFSSLLSPLRRNADGSYILPGESPGDSEQIEVFAGWKDLVLLLQLETEHVRTTVRLVQAYLLQTASMSSGNSQISEKAASLINEVLKSSYVEVQILLSPFDISLESDSWEEASSSPERSRTIMVAGNDRTH